ncbi:MAG: disulfide bond formation protein B [Acidobacteriota bacterium]
MESEAPRAPTAAEHETLEPEWLLVFGAWGVAAAGTAGSLFFSEVMELPPCVLCWYQRICLFPLVVILARALFPLDTRVVRYALPIAVLGWLTAGYHNLIYLGVVPENLQPCSRGVPCSQESATWFGFLSIPLLSLLGFTLITVLLVAVSRRSSR